MKQTGVEIGYFSLTSCEMFMGILMGWVPYVAGPETGRVVSVTIPPLART